MKTLRLLSIVTVICLVGLGLLHINTGAASSPEYVKVAIIPPQSVRHLKPALAQNGSEDFQALLNRAKPVHAVNGTFYDREFRPLGDIWYQGKRLAKGHYPNAFAVTNDGKAVLLRKQKGQSFNGKNYRMLVAAGPLLLQNGKVVVDPTKDGFGVAAKLIRARRTGIGIRKDGSVMLMVAERSQTLENFARLMQDAGAVHALNLDGGSVSAMCKDGRIVSHPYKPMSNVILSLK